MDVDLARYRDDTATRISRLRHHPGAGQDADPVDGALELTFASGAVLFCDSGPDGDTVTLAAEAWTDPFAEPLSPANAEYVHTHGRWVRHDVSADEPFADLIGRPLFDLAPVSGLTGRLYGLVLNFSGYQLAVYNPADELRAILLT